MAIRVEVTGRLLILTALSEPHLLLHLSGPLSFPLILNMALCVNFVCMNNIIYATDLGQTKSEVV